MLLQCVDLHTIGVYNCDRNTIAGVSCPNVNSLRNMTAKLTTKLLNMVSMTSSNHESSLSSSYVGSTAAVTIGIIVVVVAVMIAITLKMKLRYVIKTHHLLLWSGVYNTNILLLEILLCIYKIYPQEW